MTHNEQRRQTQQHLVRRYKVERGAIRKSSSCCKYKEITDQYNQVILLKYSKMPVNRSQVCFRITQIEKCSAGQYGRAAWTTSFNTTVFHLFADLFHKDYSLLFKV